MSSQIEILFVSANAPSPIARQRIRPEVEYRDIMRKLRGARYGHRFKLLPPLFATRVDDLQEDLSYFRPHVIHFAGHADPSGIELEDEHGRVVKMDMQSLSHILEAANRPALDSDGNGVKLIVLHACNTSGHAETLTAVADFAIGTPADVWDEDSINFAPAFYYSLASGQSLDAALTSALGVARTKNYLTNHSLKLFRKSGADPSAPFITHVLGRAAKDTQRRKAVEQVRHPLKSPPEEKAKDGPPGKKNALRWRRYKVDDDVLDEERKWALEARRKRR